MGNRKRLQDLQNRFVHFYQLRKMHNKSTLTLDKADISAIDQYIYFGVIFDKRPTFIP